MILTTWGCKVCLLLMYNKLTFGLTQQTLVKIIAVYIGVGFLLMEILYFGVWCRPFSQYWAVPTSNSEKNFLRSPLKLIPPQYNALQPLTI